MDDEKRKKDAEKVIKEGAKKVKTEDVEKVLKKEKEIEAKFTKAGPLKRFFEDLILLINLLKDYWNKRYQEVPWWIIAAIVTALLYVLNHFDIIPDFIPVIGYIDDSVVVAVCLKMIKQDLLKYREWKIKNSPEELEY